MAVFEGQNSPLGIFNFAFFTHLSSWSVREVRFGPPNFDRRLKMRVSSNNCETIIFDHFTQCLKGLSEFSPTYYQNSAPTCKLYPEKKTGCV